MLFNANHPSLIAILLCSVLAAHGPTQPHENTDVGKAPPSPVFRVGGGVSAPKAIYAPDPEFSEKALAANYGGTCVLRLVVGPDGKPRDIRVLQTLGLGLDEKAIEAVKNWRFEPSMKDGKPVDVQVNVEIVFHSHGEKTRISKIEDKANAGDPKAELELSRAYFEGRDDLPKNEVRGLELLQRAAYLGLAKAQFLMGERAYGHGGSSADYVNAYMWYDLARRGGYNFSDEILMEVASKMS